MRHLNRSTWGFAALAVVAVGGLFALVIAVSGVGERAIEAWIDGQLRSIAEAYLKPELTIAGVDYQAPLTVELIGLRLAADDPDDPGSRVDIISARRARIELKEIPREGRPIKIASVQLDGATVRLVDQAGGGLVGFADFLVEALPDDGTPLSEVLQITEAVITDGAIEYDAREPGTEPMRFDQINTVVKIDEGEGAVYGLDLALDRLDGLAIEMRGSADLDQMVLDVEALKADLDLSRRTDRYLPPQAQAFIKEHALEGALSVQAAGRLDLVDAAASKASATLVMTDAHGQVGGYQLPIEKLEADASIGGGQVTLERFVGELLGGELHGRGSVALDEGLSAQLILSGNGLRLSQVMVEEDGEPVPVAGKIDLQASTSAPLRQVLTKMAGKGELRLTDGRIARVPIISNLIDFMESSGSITRGDGEDGRDEAVILFELRGDHAYLNKADIVGTWFAMRGRGKIYFEDKLAMNINAGPMEKIQERLGALGAALGGITDGLLTYRVRGSFGDMTVRPVPLGGIIGAPGDDGR